MHVHKIVRRSPQGQCAPSTLTLDAASTAPAEARAFIDELPFELSTEQRDDIRLGLSELVSNSVLHGSTRPVDRIAISITASDEQIRCEVADEGPGFRLLDLRRSAPSATGGLGLILVNRLAARSGMRRGGRTVWFELDRAS